MEVTSESGRLLGRGAWIFDRIVFLQRCMHRSIRFSPINSGPSPASRNSTVGDSPFSALETHSRLNHSAYRIREPVILMTAGSEARYCACSGENRSSLMLTFSLHRAIICMGFAGRIDVPYAMPHAQSDKMNASNMSPAAAAIPPTAAPVLPITPGLPGISPWVISCFRRGGRSSSAKFRLYRDVEIGGRISAAGNRDEERITVVCLVGFRRIRAGDQI